VCWKSAAASSEERAVMDDAPVQAWSALASHVGEPITSREVSYHKRADDAHSRSSGGYRIAPTREHDAC